MISARSPNDNLELQNPYGYFHWCWILFSGMLSWVELWLDTQTALCLRAHMRTFIAFTGFFQTHTGFFQTHPKRRQSTSSKLTFLFHLVQITHLGHRAQIKQACSLFNLTTNISIQYSKPEPPCKAQNCRHSTHL